MHLYNLCFAVLAVVMESFKSVPSFNLPCPRLYFYFQLLISNAQFLKSAQLNMFASYSAQYRLTSNSWQYLINDVLLFVLFSLQPYCSEQPKHFLLAISTHLAINSVCGRHCTFVMASPTQKWKKKIYIYLWSSPTGVPSAAMSRDDVFTKWHGRSLTFVFLCNL